MLVLYVVEVFEWLVECVDIVIFINLQDDCCQLWIEQFVVFGIVYCVECNQGGKGDLVVWLVVEYGNFVIVFVDDFVVYYDFVLCYVFGVYWLYMVLELMFVVNVLKVLQVYVWIDDWCEVVDWIVVWFDVGVFVEV